ncbi:MAG: hypothetical protein CL607_22560 [Anaerolineaceae bacterium]|nr:hypothetical protein [Anaerolineaceae bacterium]
MIHNDIVEDLEVVLRVALSQVAPDAVLMTKRMFGGAGFFVYGKIFAAWFRNDRLSLKLSEIDREYLLSLDDTAQSMMSAYIDVPTAWLTDPDALAPWLERSLAYSVKGK